MALALFPQSGGDAGIRQTLNHMARLVNASFLDPLIRDQAVSATSGCGRGDKACLCHALNTWVSRSVRYVSDPRGVELLHDPRLMARGIQGRKLVYGDCDDMSMYLAALLKSVGLDPAFHAAGYNGRPYQHVYVVCHGLKLDPTRSAWTPTHAYSMQETSIMKGTI